MRLVVIAVLGRTLSSADFGVVAAALSVNVILFGIRDVGIGRALVQRKDIHDRHLSTTFAVSTYLGIVFTAILLVAAPWIGRFFQIEDSVDVIRALAVLFLLRGVALQSRMVCEREMRFNTVALIDAGTFALGSLVAIGAAVYGAGPWALVLGYVVEEGVSAALYMIASRPHASLRIDGQSLRELMSFGVGQTITQMTGMGATYGDNWVVGHELGATALGFYTRAYDLIKLPSFIFEAIVGKVLFSAFSRIQDDRERLAAAFRRIAFANALVLFPASALVIVLAHEVIRILIGAGWESSVLPLQILGITILPRTSQKLGAIVTQAAGRANAMALAHSVYMIVVVVGAMISIRWGIVGVATTTALAIVVVYAHCSILGMQVSGLPARAFFAAHLPGALLAVLVTAIAVPLTEILRAAELAAPLVLGIVSLVALVACLAVLVLWIRRKRGDFGWLADEVGRLRRRKRPQIA